MRRRRRSFLQTTLCRGRTRTAFRSWTGRAATAWFSFPRRLRCWRTLVGPLVSAEYCEVLLLCPRFRSAWRVAWVLRATVVRRCWGDFRRDIFELHAPVDEVGTTDYTCVVTQSGANCSSETDGASIGVGGAPICGGARRPGVVPWR